MKSGRCLRRSGHFSVNEPSERSSDGIFEWLISGSLLKENLRRLLAEHRTTPPPINLLDAEPEFQYFVSVPPKEF